MRIGKYTGVFLLLAGLTACAGLGRDAAPGADFQTERIAPEPNPATASLLESALQERAAGRYDRAAAALERALRIAPRNVAVLQELARVRLEQGDAWQAEALALKANSFAVGDDELLAENWDIIAAARRTRGDMMGAAAAERAAAALRGVIR